MKKFIQFYIKFVQKILITILLTIVYFFVLGPTLLLILIFKRNLLYKNFKNKDTFWIQAKDYTADFESNVIGS